MLLFIGGNLYFVYKRAAIRKGIRNKLEIQGGFYEDIYSHFCFPCCALCQESREAKAVGLKLIDFCSGEEMFEENHNSSSTIGSENRDRTLSDLFSSSHGDSSSPALNNESLFRQFYARLSKASIIILGVWCVFFVLCLLLLVLAGRPYNIAVLLLIFLQPITILYFIYWRTKRNVISLDYVVKLFAVGFFFTSFQCIVIEVSTCLQHPSTLFFFLIITILPSLYFLASCTVFNRCFVESFYFGCCTSL